MIALSRRRALQALSVIPAAGFVGAMPRIARAAEFSLKYGNNLPLTHPLNIRAQEAADRIAKETGGRVEISIFPNNQLGGDTDMLAQVRNGGISFFTPSALVAATLVPVAAINAVGFAFADYDQVWKAMDGKLGAHVRAALARVGLYTFEKSFGIDPVQFGLIMIFNLILGTIHPPIGVVLFVTARIADISYETMSRAILPWLVPLLIVLVAITVWPPLTTWLPHVLMDR